MLDRKKTRNGRARNSNTNLARTIIGPRERDMQKRPIAVGNSSEVSRTQDNQTITKCPRRPPVPRPSWPNRRGRVGSVSSSARSQECSTVTESVIMPPATDASSVFRGGDSDHRKDRRAPEESAWIQESPHVHVLPLHVRESVGAQCAQKIHGCHWRYWRREDPREESICSWHSLTGEHSQDDDGTRGTGQTKKRRAHRRAKNAPTHPADSTNEP